MLLKNSAVYDAEIGKDYVPKNADDFKRVLQAADQTAQRQPAGASARTPTRCTTSTTTRPCSAPRTTGRSTPAASSPRTSRRREYKEAIGYVRDLVGPGVYHPDALTIADSTVARNDLIGSKYVLDVETFGNAWQDAWTRGPKQHPPVTPQAVLPFPAHDGGKAQHFLGHGYFGTTAFKAASPDRIKELLRIANWLAAPFGSAEDLLLTVGVKDVDYTLGADGSITVLPPSNTDANSVPWKYIVQRPQVAFWPGIPDYAKAATDFEKAAIARRRGRSDARLLLGHPGQQGHPAGAGPDRRHHRRACRSPTAERFRPDRQGLAEQRRQPDPHRATTSPCRRLRQMLKQGCGCR